MRVGVQHFIPVTSQRLWVWGLARLIIFYLHRHREYRRLFECHLGATGPHVLFCTVIRSDTSFCQPRFERNALNTKSLLRSGDGCWRSTAPKLSRHSSPLTPSWRGWRSRFQESGTSTRQSRARNCNRRGADLPNPV